MTCLPLRGTPDNHILFVIAAVSSKHLEAHIAQRLIENSGPKEVNSGACTGSDLLTVDLK